MSTRDPAAAPEAHGDILFSERRRGSFVFWFLAVGIPAILVYTTYEGIRDDFTTQQVVTGLLIGVFLYAFFLLLFLGPWGGEFKHLRVDGRGVWMRGKLLPAEQIGRISVLGEAEAARAVFTARYDGMWLLRGVFTYSPIASHGRAVYVEQRRPDGSRRPWILGTNHPRELSYAARFMRDSAPLPGRGSR